MAKLVVIRYSLAMNTWTEAVEEFDTWLNSSGVVTEDGRPVATALRELDLPVYIQMLIDFIYDEAQTVPSNLTGSVNFGPITIRAGGLVEPA